MRFGFAFFKTPLAPEEGIYSIAGAEVVFFSSVSELPSDVLWWTNVQYRTLNQASLSAISTLRMDKYLPISPDDCLMEWGFIPAETSNASATRFLSQCFFRIMSIAEKLISEIAPRKPKHLFFTSADLRLDLATVMPKQAYVYPKGDAASILKAGYSFVEYSGVSRSGLRGVPRIVMRRPRLAHAIDMFFSPIPDGGLEFMENGISLTEALNSEKPILAEVVVERADRTVAPVFAYGHSINTSQRVVRAWVPHPELIALSAFAEITVKNAWIGRGYTRLIDIASPAVIRFLQSDYTTLSWSAGIIADLLWRCQSIRDQSSSPIPKSARADASWIGAWLKSSDKTLSFMASLDLEAASGIPVSSYGQGTAQFQCPTTATEELIRIGAEMGMIPRTDCIPNDYTWSPDHWGGDKKSLILSTLMLQKKRTAVMGLDKIMLVPEDERRDAMAKVFQQLKKA